MGRDLASFSFMMIPNKPSSHSINVEMYILRIIICDPLQDPMKKQLFHDFPLQRNIISKISFPKLFLLTLQTLTPASNQVKINILNKTNARFWNQIHNIHIRKKPVTAQVLKSTDPMHSRILIYDIQPTCT